ncbi:MAG: hypothetical protein A2857_03540 [Candidatus Levybacteria bacterium RIFCSPHIGHO2_01_FULL_36_15]|nr:MAG: hypothetical protein A2857_03540 [Candidatus Levybacteria bacterium RIFCSPHIGHO2_01_FULL_36_15]
MKILLVQNSQVPSAFSILPKHIKAIEKVSKKCKVVLVDVTKLSEHLADADILLVPSSMIGKINTKKSKILKWIHVTSAGVNNLPEQILKSDIIITNSSGVHPIPIAEQVFTYMLMFARNINQAIKSKAERKWLAHYEFNVFEVHGKTIGIVGFGRIGEKIAQLSKAFNMKVFGVTKTKRNSQKNVDRLFTLKDLDKLLSASDFVISCLPGTRETYHLFDKNKFSMMKKSAYFINIGRGSTVDEKDLISALGGKIIKGAGLDVFEKEPLMPDSALWTMDNVILTPHNAGLTPFYMDRVIDIFCENLKAYLSKKLMPNLVDKKLGY